MKVPFSYRDQFFAQVLTVSFLGHAAFFASGGIFPSHPRYAVDPGLSSVEVFILKEEVKERDTPKNDAVFLTKEAIPELPAAIQKKIEKQPERKINKSIYIPPAEGALAEAKPAYLKNPAPRYPLEAREKRWEGVVVLNVLVEKDGIPAQVSVEKSSGYVVLDEAALTAVKKWRFLPSRIGSSSLASRVRIPIRFKLENAHP